MLSFKDFVSGQPLTYLPARSSNLENAECIPAEIAFKILSVGFNSFQEQELEVLLPLT
jgi:hypothetical protein